MGHQTMPALFACLCIKHPPATSDIQQKIFADIIDPATYTGFPDCVRPQQYPIQLQVASLTQRLKRPAFLHRLDANIRWFLYKHAHVPAGTQPIAYPSHPNPMQWYPLTTCRHCTQLSVQNPARTYISYIMPYHPHACVACHPRLVKVRTHVPSTQHTKSKLSRCCTAVMQPHHIPRQQRTPKHADGALP